MIIQGSQILTRVTSSNFMKTFDFIHCPSLLQLVLPRMRTPCWTCTRTRASSLAPRRPLVSSCRNRRRDLPNYRFHTDNFSLLTRDGGGGMMMRNFSWPFPQFIVFRLLLLSPLLPMWLLRLGSIHFWWFQFHYKIPRCHTTTSTWCGYLSLAI